MRCHRRRFTIFTSLRCFALTILETSKSMVMDLATRGDVIGVVLHLVHEDISRICRVINEVIDIRIRSPVLGRGGFINDLANGSLHICGQPVSEIFVGKDSLLKLQKIHVPSYPEKSMQVEHVSRV